MQVEIVELQRRIGSVARKSDNMVESVVDLDKGFTNRIVVGSHVVHDEYVALHLCRRTEELRCENGGV